MDAQDYCTRWRENAERRGVPPHVLAEISRRHDITRASFVVLARMQEIKDPAGQSFFLLPPSVRGGDARAAALMTYILNAGTDYGAAGKRPTDFPATPPLRRRGDPNPLATAGKRLELHPRRPVRAPQRGGAWAPPPTAC